MIKLEREDSFGDKLQAQADRIKEMLIGAQMQQLSASERDALLAILCALVREIVPEDCTFILSMFPVDQDPIEEAYVAGDVPQEESIMALRALLAQMEREEEEDSQ